MPGFPDYVAQEGLAVPSAPQVEANTAVGRSLNDFGQTLEEAGGRFTARQQQQADFDDQVTYQRYTLAQGQALQQAQAGMAPEAGLFQFDEPTANSVGVNDHRDPIAATEGAADLAVSNYWNAKKTLGDSRKPIPQAKARDFHPHPQTIAI